MKESDRAFFRKLGQAARQVGGNVARNTASAGRYVGGEIREEAKFHSRLFRTREERQQERRIGQQVRLQAYRSTLRKRYNLSPMKKRKKGKKSKQKIIYVLR